jgi:predicted amidohydrolase YtcJ
MLLVNSKGLAIVGLDRAAQDPPNGRIERDHAGELTGEFKESAMDTVTRLLPAPGPDEADLALQRIMARAASFGLTSVHLVNGLSPAEMTAFERALARKTLALRFYVAVPFTEDTPDSALARYVALKNRYRGPLLKFGSAKGILDGTVDARTAAMLAPYVGAGTETGIPMWRQDALDRTVARYDKAGLQVMLHAIGDRAIRMALDAFEGAARTNHSSNRRHRIEHLEVPDSADLPRFKQLGVIASTQAMFAYPDATTLGNYAGLLGPARASRANAFKRLDDAGATQAFGSDFPVFTMEVLKGINTAVNRTTAEGTPAGGWYPDNRISVDRALRHFTRDGAFASFDEADKGTLEAGKLADFVVLSKDILTEPPAKLLAAKVLLTVMGGRETYRAGPTAWTNH